MPRPVKHSFTIDGHRTSISLEAPFWEALKEAASELDQPVARIVQSIDLARTEKSKAGDEDEGGLSSAVRIWILDYYRRRRTSDAIAPSPEVLPPQASTAPRSSDE